MGINSWQQKGKLYIWRYEEPHRSYPVWQMSGDDEGLKSLIELLNLMLQTNHNCKRTIKLSEPTTFELSISGCVANAVPESKFTFYYEVEEVQEWVIKPFSDSMDIVSNRYATNGFKTSLSKLLDGENDFSFGHGESQIWFW